MGYEREMDYSEDISLTSSIEAVAWILNFTCQIWLVFTLPIIS